MIEFAEFAHLNLASNGDQVANDDGCMNFICKHRAVNDVRGHLLAKLIALLETTSEQQLNIRVLKGRNEA